MDIDKLKKKHGVDSIYAIEVEDENGNVDATGYFKEITIDTLDMFASLARSQNFYVAIRTLFNTLWLDGDSKMKDDEETFQSAVKNLELILTGNQIRFEKDDLKYKYIMTDDEGKEYTCTVRRPKLEEHAIVTEKNPTKSFLKLLEKIWLGGDNECKTDVKNVIALSSMLTQVMETRASKIKKL